MGTGLGYDVVGCGWWWRRYKKDTGTGVGETDRSAHGPEINGSRKERTAQSGGGGSGMNVNPFNRSQIREMIRTWVDVLKRFLTHRLLHFSLSR